MLMKNLRRRWKVWWTTRDGPTDRWNGAWAHWVCVNRPSSWPGYSGQPPDPAVTLFHKMTITRLKIPLYFSISCSSKFKIFVYIHHHSFFSFFFFLSHVHSYSEIYIFFIFSIQLWNVLWWIYYFYCHYLKSWKEIH